MPQVTQLDDVPVVPSYDNSASTGFFALFDEVDVFETLPSVSFPELLSQVVVANATGIHHGSWREDVLLVFEPVIRMDVEPDSATGGAPQHLGQRFAQLLQQHK